MVRFQIYVGDRANGMFCRLGGGLREESGNVIKEEYWAL